jgi:hypothetical protein
MEGQKERMNDVRLPQMGLEMKGAKTSLSTVPGEE